MRETERERERERGARRGPRGVLLPGLLGRGVAPQGTLGARRPERAPRRCERRCERRCSAEAMAAGVGARERRRRSGMGGADGLVAEPEDTLYAVYVIFTVMGICMLFPWNAFINASSYFYVRFKGSPHATNFEDLFAVTFTTANTLVLGLFTLFPQTQRW